LADGRLLTVETKIEVQSQVHELVSIAIGSAEKALVLFFDHAARQIEPNSAESNCTLKAGYRSKDGLRPQACISKNLYGSHSIAICILQISSRNNDRSNSHRFGFN
jgi:hypothetical protein